MGILSQEKTPCAYRAFFSIHPPYVPGSTAWIYQRAGSTAEMACKITGILSMGNIMPESNMVGIISISPDIDSPTGYKIKK